MENVNEITNNHSRNVVAWLSLGMMERVEQVRNIAELLCATMEDLSDKVADLDSTLDYLSNATEAIQDRIDEMMNLIQGDYVPELLSTEADADASSDDLPF